MPEDITPDSIRLRKDGVDFLQWPVLSCSAANQLDLDVSDLRLDADRSLQFQGNGQIRTAGSLRLFTDTPVATEKLSILANGNVGIGNPTPTTKLEVNGTVKATSFQGDGSTLTGVVKQAGDSTIIGSLTVQNNLTVQGNLEVTGETIFRNIEQHQGDLELGDADTDQVRIHGVVRSTHSSRVLQVDSSMKVNGTVTADQVGIGTASPNAALHVIGNLLGAARDTSGNALRICCGATPEGKTAWQEYDTSSSGVYVDVDTSMCRFSTTPIYIINMHGSGYNWETTGGSSAYDRTATSFRVYVKFSDGRALTPAFANSYGWHIQWVAIGN